MTTRRVILVGAALLAAVACAGFALLPLDSDNPEMRCKARASEARTNLTTVFVGEREFFHEHQRYTSDLVAIGFSPSGSPRYLIGFARADSGALPPAIPGHDPSRRATDDPRVTALTGKRDLFSPARMTTKDGRPLNILDLAPRSMAGTTGFLASAVGNIDDGGKLDLWTIDQTRALVHLSNGCAY